jgi:hypothetical protein
VCSTAGAGGQNALGKLKKTTTLADGPPSLPRRDRFASLRLIKFFGRNYQADQP